MGDRANICFKMENDQEIYLYTHWGGYKIKEVLKQALIRGQKRWIDEQYLVRIVFSEMIKDEILQEIGYGITTYLCDNDRPIIYVNVEDQSIEIDDMSMSFNEYIQKEWEEKDE
jgi:hypothetical protein